MRLAAALLVLAQALPGVPEGGAAPAPIPWSTLVENRGAYLGQRVRLVVQHHSWISHWNPYQTRFGPRDFAALHAWADEQFPWERSDYEEPAVRAFVRRGSAVEALLGAAKTYDRFELVVQVRQVFLDTPWVEVVNARPLEERLVEGTVIHAARARLLIDGQAWDLAADELGRALAAPAPPLARTELERLLTGCRAARRAR